MFQQENKNNINEDKNNFNNENEEIGNINYRVIKEVKKLTEKNI